MEDSGRNPQEPTIGEKVDDAKHLTEDTAKLTASGGADVGAWVDVAKRGTKYIVPVAKRGIYSCAFLIFFGFFFFTAGMSALTGGSIGELDSVTASTGTGVGGAATGSPMDIENGTALSSDEIDKLIDMTPAMNLLKGGGKSLYDTCKAQRVNPLFLFGIARHESNFGQVYARNPSSKFGTGKNMLGLDWSAKYTFAYKYEMGGASGRHKVAYFHTWADSLSEAAALLRRSYLNPGGTYTSRVQSFVNSKGEDIIEAVLEVYSPYSDGNNPKSYATDVRKNMRGWCQNLGINPDQPRSK